MSGVILTKAAIENLSRTLQGMDVEEPVLVAARGDSGRPYVVIGAPDEYGKIPKLVIDDLDVWHLEGVFE